MTSDQLYTPAIRAILQIRAEPNLFVGSVPPAAHALLRNATVATLFAGVTVQNHAAAEACHSGLWLAVNGLHESHTISQNLETPEGSFWHGIMHRREGDYSNAKYWFRRASAHAALPAIGNAIQRASTKSSPVVDLLVRGSVYDACKMTDLCEEVSRGKQTHQASLQAIQQIEWNELFAVCYKLAVAS